MTDREKAIVMAYTGIAMLIGDKFDIFHKYVEEIMRRPVFSHEFATCAEEIKEKAKPDFLKLCAEEEFDRPHGTWLERYYKRFKYYCSNCGSGTDRKGKFCDTCGTDMRKEAKRNDRSN